MRFCGEAQERKEFWETRIRPLERRKALKGKAHERWGLKEVLKDLGSYTPPRG
jgi:hypothetical protein